MLLLGGGGVGAEQSLEMVVELSDGHLGVAAMVRLGACVIAEHVLLFGLHHVVALRAHARHVAVDVHGVVLALGVGAGRRMLHPFEHRVHHQIAAGASHARTAVHHNRTID